MIGAVMGDQQQDPGNKGAPDVAVDHTLEADISVVEQAVDSYLATLSDAARAHLFEALEMLDEPIENSDSYRQRLSYPAVYKSTVFGATSDYPVTEQMRISEFQAEIALVRAAKAVVVDLSADNLSNLWSASEALKVMNHEEGS
jgi:hypothetical protein